VRIAIVTDSTCDLPARLVKEMSIQVVPINFVMGQETYLDGIDITREAFYDLLPTLPDLPQTSAPAPGIFEEVYRQLLNEADAIVSIHLAATLSGIYSAACVGAGAVEATERITVIDSGQLSMGLGWAVLAAAEASQAGESLQVVRSRITETLQKVRVFAIFNTMEYLLKGGRISWLRANTGDLLRFKPMIELRDGDVLSRACGLRL
jgi:DegV family protein with EDD domain